LGYTTTKAWCEQSRGAGGSPLLRSGAMLRAGCGCGASRRWQRQPVTGDVPRTRGETLCIFHQSLAHTRWYRRGHSSTSLTPTRCTCVGFGYPPCPSWTARRPWASARARRPGRRRCRSRPGLACAPRATRSATPPRTLTAGCGGVHSKSNLVWDLIKPASKLLLSI
jgi:hypothetical protein